MTRKDVYRLLDDYKELGLNHKAPGTYVYKALEDGRNVYEVVFANGFHWYYEDSVRDNSHNMSFEGASEVFDWHFKRSGIYPTLYYWVRYDAFELVGSGVDNEYVDEDVAARLVVKYRQVEFGTIYGT